jgi:tRNA (uracil-5-)-methyltransferase TRM9
VYILGSDRSLALTQIAGAANRPSDVIVADILSFPHPPHAFDFAICIAVIHHLSTTPRRVDAIRSVLAVLKPGGTALFYVWALEQASSRRGWDEGGEQDVMVPWVSKAKREEGGEQVFQRYYHLYRKGELEENVASAGGEVVESGYEKDNWWAIARPNMVSNEQEQT